MSALEQVTEPRAIYTLIEVATVLRVSTETIRRKIALGELTALEIGGTQRKQYRIFATDLARWLGSERAAQLFGIGHALDVVRAALQNVSEQECELIIDQAVGWAKAQRVEHQGPFLSTPTSEDIKKRFKQ